MTSEEALKELEELIDAFEKLNPDKTLTEYIEDVKLEKLYGKKAVWGSGDEEILI